MTDSRTTRPAPSHEQSADDRKRRPSFQFYPADHRKDLGLQACSLEARGLWAEMLCLMHEGEPYGHLGTGGTPMSEKALARFVGTTAPKVRRLLAELRENTVFSTSSTGVVYCRRMVRDEHNRNARGEHGRKSLQNPNVPRPKAEVGTQERYPSGNPFSPNSGGSPSSSSSSSSSTATAPHAHVREGRVAGGGREEEQRNTPATGAADTARSEAEWIADDGAWEIPERAAEYAGTGVVPASERPAMLARILARPADELARYGIRGSITRAAIEWGKSRTRSGGTGAAVRELGITLPPHINPEVARLVTGWAAAHEAEASALLDAIKSAAPAAGEATWAGRFVAEAKKRAQAEGIAA